MDGLFWVLIVILVVNSEEESVSRVAAPVSSVYCSYAMPGLLTVEPLTSCWHETWIQLLLKTVRCLGGTNEV